MDRASFVLMVEADQAERPFVVALDAGTSSVRALAFDRRGRAISGTETQIAYELTTTPDGGAEMDPLALCELLARCVDGTIQALNPETNEIAAVAMSCFWHSLLGVDNGGFPVTPVFYWADTRSARFAEELREELDETTIHARTGCVFHSSYWPAKLRWLRETQPERYQAAARWTSFADFVMRQFLDIDQMSLCMAAGTGLLKVVSGTWDTDLLAAIEIDASTLPPLVDRDRATVSLTPAFAERWPVLAQIPWLPPLGDGACANLGSGAIAPDRIALTVGTTGALRVIVPSPVGVSLAVPRDLWAYRLDRHHVVLGAAISNGGLLLSWLADLLRSPLDGDDVARAATLAPDSHGLTILPFLAGERSPIWNDRATAVIAGLTLHTQREHIIRAAMESVAYRFSRLYDALREVALPDHQIVANGAAILRSPTWLQITADVLAHPLLALPPGDEASARGAAVAALDALGLAPLGSTDDPAMGASLIRPNAAHFAAYQAGRNRQEQLEHLLFPHGGRWDASLHGVLSVQPSGARP